MQYMILIYEPEAACAAAVVPACLGERVMRLAADLRERGWLRDGAELQDVSTATTVVSLAGRQTLHDGPFAETRERLGGYFRIDAPNLDDALSFARRVPVADGGKVEVRPLAVV